MIGTYRVLRQEVAQTTLGFYTQGEYDIAPLIAARSPRYRFMELGRSCVLKPYRTKRTVELLWHGLWTYVREHKVDVMIGCASFEGDRSRRARDGAVVPPPPCAGAARVAREGAPAAAHADGPVCPRTRSTRRRR